MGQIRNQRLIVHLFVVANFVRVHDGPCGDAGNLARFERSRAVVARDDREADGLHFGRDYVAEELSGLRLSKVSFPVTVSQSYTESGVTIET